MKIHLRVLVLYKADIIIIPSKVTCSRHDIAEKIAHLALNNNQSLNHYTICEKLQNYFKKKVKQYNVSDILYVY